MACELEFVVGEYGRAIQIDLTEDDVPFNLTGYTVTYIVKKPNGIVANWTASIVGDAVDGKTKFTPTDATYLEQVGFYSMRVKLTKAGVVTFWPKLEWVRVHDTSKD